MLTQEVSMASLFVIVPGFGRPHLTEKLQILQSNLAIIRKYPWTKISVTVCCYDNAVVPFDDPDITWVYEAGIVGQFITRHAADAAIQSYDYVLVILDDVELQTDFNFHKLLELDTLFHMDIYSPTMTLDCKYQFEYMLTKKEIPAIAKITTACEAFCYFMRKDAFQRWRNEIDPERNPWLWGMDMCLFKCLGIRIMMLNHMTINHHYKGECYAYRPDANPCDGYNSVLQKHNVTSEDLADQPAVLYWIFDTRSQ